MPALKLMKQLYLKRKLDPCWISRLKDHEVKDHMFADVLQLLLVDNSKEQIDLIKKVSREIGQRLKSNTDHGIECSLEFLVHLFFISTSKNAARRVIISTFQNLPDRVQQSVIRPLIKTNLVTMCGYSVKESMSHTDTRDSIDETYNHRHDVDTISALFENFTLGEECVVSIFLEILGYLAKVLSAFIASTKSPLSPVQQNEVMHNCMETIKVTNKLCQKSLINMEGRDFSVAEEQQCRDISLIFIQANITILQTYDFLMDCKMNSAMNICLMLKLTCTRPRERLLISLSSIIFQHHEHMNILHHINDMPDWLKKLDFNQLSKTSMTNSAYLCLCYGYLAMVSLENMVCNTDGKCLLLDVILLEFLDLSQRCTDVASKLLAVKSICFLTQKIRSHMEKNDDELRNNPRFIGISNDMQVILNFVWTAWEDPMDAIRFTIKDIFENVVAIHLAVCGHGSVKDDQFLQKLSRSILNDVSWSCKGKYGTLSVLVSHLGSEKLLTLYPRIAVEILQQMQEQTLACYASDLYENLYKSHMAELQADDKSKADKAAWYNYWVDPVLDLLSEDSNSLQKKHVIEYILPKLLKTGQDTLCYMIHTLTDKLSQTLYNLPVSDSNMSRKSQSGSQFGALIMCLRRARVLGQLKPEQKQSFNAKESAKELLVGSVKDKFQADKTENKGVEMWYGVVDVELLRLALICKCEQIRLDAFALLCDNQKTSEVISQSELRLIKSFIPQNLNNQNPAFRQQYLSHLKKLLARMKESSLAMTRMADTDKSYLDGLHQYNDFLNWLSTCFWENLYSGSTFARRATCLAGLSLLMDIYGNTSVYQFHFYDSIHEVNIYSLLHCLADTFEDNQSEAAKILTACSKFMKSGIFKDEVIKELFNQALSLSLGTRPQDSTTASYLFSVLTHLPGLFNILIQHILASNVNAETNEDSEHFVNSESFHQIIPNDEFGRQYLLLHVLLKNLEAQAKTAKASLIIAAANTPLYPTMQCMRHILADVNFRAIPKDLIPIWRRVLARILTLCMDISAIVAIVVCNSSPEGNVPIDSVTGICSEDIDMISLTKSHETVTSMPEYLIVCCWRSVKEISLILGQLGTDLPLMDINDPDQSELLSHNQVLQIGEFFTNLLLESRHRGAFELAYAGFVKLTDSLWRSCCTQIHQLPRKWLTEVMSDINSTDPQSRLCATRRSAGVPFYIQALVSTEPASTGRQCFRHTMNELLAMALDGSHLVNGTSNSTVHALNILRALYKDSRLKDDVALFVADGLKVAVLGFKSPQWAVRNSATLLMSTMMTRIFGVKRSKDESSVSRKNCQTGRYFFYNYPSLYQFLLDEIATSTEHINSLLQPGLYPVLMVLGRLFPSTMEGTETTLNLAAFIPFVIKCSANPVLKIRIMAAKALQPLVDKGHVTSVFSSLLQLLPCQQTDILRHNQIHGVLLMLHQMLKTVPFLAVSTQNDLGMLICSMWLEKMCLLTSRSNPCMLTRKEAIEVTATVIEQFGSNPEIHKLRDQLNKVIQLEILPCNIYSSDIEYVDVSNIHKYSRWTPCLSEFQVTICRLYSQFIFKMFPFSQKFHSALSLQENFSQKELDLIKNSEGVQNYDLHNSKRNEAECAIVKFLQSASYEVRLEMLVNLMKFSESEYSLFGKPMVVSSEFDGNITSRETCTRNKMIVQDFNFLKSRKIWQSLKDMVDLETNEDCLIEVYRLLPRFLIGLHQPSDQYTSMCEIQRVGKLLDKIVAQNSSDRLKASTIFYCGTVLSNMLSITHLTNHCAATNLTSDCAVLGALTTTTIKQFVDTLRNYSRQIETDLDILLACTHSIGMIAQHFAHRSVPDCFLITADIYMCVLDLLQADDIDVREAAADVVTSQCSSKLSFHPYAAVELLLEALLAEGDVQLVVELLLKAICEQKADYEDSEERLFDRGKINAYWDEVDFVKTLDIFLQKTVQEYLKRSKARNEDHAKDMFLESDTERWLQEVKHSNQEDSLINPVHTFLTSISISKYLSKEEVDLALSTVNGSKQEVDFASSVVNNKEFNFSIINGNFFCGVHLHQKYTVSVLRILILLQLKCYYHDSVEHINLLQKLKSHLDINRLPPFISEKLKIVCDMVNNHQTMLNHN